jgi:hypothetical protein
MLIKEFLPSKVKAYCRTLPYYVETMPLTKKESKYKWKMTEKRMLLFA